MHNIHTGKKTRQNQFINTSICTSLAFVSPGNLYGNMPANIMSVFAWLRNMFKCWGGIKNNHYKYLTKNISVTAS